MHKLVRWELLWGAACIVVLLGTFALSRQFAQTGGPRPPGYVAGCEKALRINAGESLVLNTPVIKLRGFIWTADDEYLHFNLSLKENSVKAPLAITTTIMTEDERVLGRKTTIVRPEDFGDTGYRISGLKLRRASVVMQQFLLPDSDKVKKYGAKADLRAETDILQKARRFSLEISEITTQSLPRAFRTP